MNKIQVIRSRSGLSQRRFADKYNIPVRTLQQWEQNVQNPPQYLVEMLQKLEAQESADGSSNTAEDANSWGYLKHVNAASGTWKICIDNPFRNCEHIYPIQQHKVREVIDAVSNDCNVKKIVIFGSSTGPACHTGSDVDIYFEVTEDVNPLNCCGFMAGWKYDAFTNFMVDSRLLKEITKKGVTVYGE